MKNMILAAAVALAPVAFAASPAIAQSAQDELDARYDRALAAGYKALFLCSGMVTMESEGRLRSPDHIEQWELAGIDPDFEPLIGDLPWREYRRENFLDVSYIAVDWDEAMPPRYATSNYGTGCRIEPIGAKVEAEEVFEVTDAAMRRPKYLTEPVDVERVVPTQALDAVFAEYMGDGSTDKPRTTAIVVTRNGETLGERFAEGFTGHTTQRTWSVAKSLAATLVGAAVHAGEADISATGFEATVEGDPRRAITIDHLLRMASGRYSDTPGNRTNPIYWGGTAVTDRSDGWPLVHEPGTVFRYANNDTLMAIKAIETFLWDPPENIFEKIGMNETYAERDWLGNYVLSSQVWSSSRDLAKFGELYLRDGSLPDGSRLLPQGWAEYVSSPSGPQPEGNAFGYGAGFWLLNNSEGVPSDTFAAMGNRGQYVVVVPSRNVVIVRRGEDPSGTRFDIAAFTRDVLATLDE